MKNTSKAIINALNGYKREMRGESRFSHVVKDGKFLLMMKNNDDLEAFSKSLK